jgi:hypothetical protein
MVAADEAAPNVLSRGQLEPAVTRLINCHFGQLVSTCLICMPCYGYEQLDCSYSKYLLQQLRDLRNLKT